MTNRIDPEDDREKIAQAMQETGIDSVIVAAYLKLGYYLTDDNRKEFTADQQQAWYKAVELERKRVGGGTN